MQLGFVRVETPDIFPQGMIRYFIKIERLNGPVKFTICVGIDVRNRRSGDGKNRIVGSVYQRCPVRRFQLKRILE